MRAGTGTAVLALATLTALQQVFSRIPAPAAKIKRPGEVPDLPVLVQIERSISLSLSTKVQQNTHTAPGTGSGAGECAGVCDIRNAGNDPMIPPLKGGNFNQAPFSSPMIDITCCNVLKRGAKREPVLQESLPLRGSRGMSGRAPSARGEGIRGAPSSLSPCTGILYAGGGST